MVPNLSRRGYDLSFMDALITCNTLALKVLLSLE